MGVLRFDKKIRDVVVGVGVGVSVGVGVDFGGESTSSRFPGTKKFPTRKVVGGLVV